MLAYWWEHKPDIKFDILGKLQTNTHIDHLLKQCPNLSILKTRNHEDLCIAWQISISKRFLSRNPDVLWLSNHENYKPAEEAERSRLYNSSMHVSYLSY